MIAEHTIFTSLMLIITLKSKTWQHTPIEYKAMISSYSVIANTGNVGKSAINFHMITAKIILYTFLLLTSNHTNLHLRL